MANDAGRGKFRFVVQMTVRAGGMVDKAVLDLDVSRAITVGWAKGEGAGR
nr:hypothetical protein [Aquicoccus sp. G2-2]MEA1113065.1 hypothetical protein [Aquicoccus sp. G2-2]